ncbi:MAG: response regulator, partial [Patescibacteria group bacterium]|nr:response regulator [Patescibacteria group bacterium]
MSVDLNLLVVDDEEAICEGCRRIFERQGFHVTKTSDPEHGLSLAGSNDYAAVLLDIKMPKMDGIQFFERLRATKPNVPVILMTGYPSVPNAVAAIRLGAAAYVTKPFTPEEITQAVRKMVHATPDGSRGAVPESWQPAEDGPRFFRNAWACLGKEGTVRAGMVADRATATAVKSVRLPGIGEVVFQGLPMAVVEMRDGTERIVPAPVSGVVEAVNESLAAAADAFATDPCGAGWMAIICPTRAEDELARCTHRRVALYSPDAPVNEEHVTQLKAFGCTVDTATNADSLATLFQNPDLDLLVLDAPATAEAGLAALDRVAALRPAMKIVVAAAARNAAESAYRTRKLFYFAVEPFTDNEMADILDAAFRPKACPQAAQAEVAPGQPLMGIELTNRNGTKIHLLAGPGVMRRSVGLGVAIRQRLLDRLYPMQTRLGVAKLTPEELVGTAAGANRLVVLLVKDLGRTPGSLVRDTKSEYVAVSGEGAGKVTTLVIQPGPDGTPDSLEPETVDMLAEHIVDDL